MTSDKPFFYLHARFLSIFSMPSGGREGDGRMWPCLPLNSWPRGFYSAVLASLSFIAFESMARNDVHNPQVYEDSVFSPR